MSLLKEDLFFVELEKPDDIERNVLEAQKDVVENLQRYENIKFLRAKKLENVNKLKGVIKELLKLISDLKIVLPQTKIKEAKVKKVTGIVKKEEKREVREVKEKKSKKPLSELEKLEAELSAIESKLSSLK